MFARHDLAWLTPRGWQHARASAPASCADAIDRWQQADWPAVVTRAGVALPADQLSIGLALTPDSAGTKTRIACHVPMAELSRHAPPLPLAHAIDAVPETWRPLLAALDRQAAAQGLAIRVYGSVALQALTGQPYLTATSDIDVLLHPVTLAQLYTGLDLLNMNAARLPLDGEIVFPGAQAVAWKELSAALTSANGRVRSSFERALSPLSHAVATATPPAARAGNLSTPVAPTLAAGTRVLVKEMHRVSLAAPSALLETLQEVYA